MSTVAESLPPGLVPPSSPQGRSGFLADVIVELGLADRESVDKANHEARLQGATLASVLVQNGVLDEREVARAVAERHGLATLDLDDFPMDPEAGALVGRTTARRYGVVPAGFAPDGSLLLAMADPGDSLARNDVAVMTKLEVTPVIAARSQIEAALELLPQTGATAREPAEPESEPEAAAGSMLWQAEEPAPDVAPRSSGMFAVETADRSAEHEARAQRLSTELAEQRGRVADLELELRSVRSELEEVRGRYERKADELEAHGRKLREELGERDAQVASLTGDLAYRDGRLGALERQLAERDAALRELEAEVASSRRGAA